MVKRSAVPAISIELPSITCGDGSKKPRGTITVLVAGKAPRLRVQPASFVRLNSELWLVVAAYRLAAQPNVWRFICEQRQNTRPIDNEFTQRDIKRGKGMDTPRVVSTPFQKPEDVNAFFLDIPRYTTRRAFTTAELLHGHVLQEGGKP